MNAPLALITGASRGLGAALAEALYVRGWQVVAVARSQGGLEELDDRLKALAAPEGAGLTLAPLDLAEAEARAQLAEALTTRWGRLDLWAHTAVHAAPLAPAAHLDAKDFAKSLATNVTALAALIPALAPLLQAAPGAHALFFDDPRAGAPHFGAYGASKAAAKALVQSWQAESAKIGPRVTLAAPPPMKTATRARFYPGEDRSPLTEPRAVAESLLKSLKI